VWDSREDILGGQLATSKRFKVSSYHKVLVKWGRTSTWKRLG
jgi:hypothetical protein